MRAEDAPKGRIMRVEGRPVHLVNWLDYRGWEVRLAVSFDEVERQNNPTSLGYVAQYEGGYDKGWEARPIESPARRGFTSMQKAVAFLVSTEGVSR